MKEQDDDFNKQRQEYNREIKHMRNLLNEREALLEGVVGEKKLVVLQYGVAMELKQFTFITEIKYVLFLSDFKYKMQIYHLVVIYY